MNTFLDSPDFGLVEASSAHFLALFDEDQEPLEAPSSFPALQTFNNYS